VATILEEFLQEAFANTSEVLAVQTIAYDLLAHLNEAATLGRIAEANRPGRSSALVQASFLGHAEELGFASEAKGLFADYPTSHLRPDYFRPMGTTGILLEVERGKTTINNMDLLDFWKCHLCSRANYLFLLVPQHLKQRIDGRTRPEFSSVRRRLAPFFEPRNYTNVRGLFLFGY
jgi:hypothetical protein